MHEERSRISAHSSFYGFANRERDPFFLSCHLRFIFIHPGFSCRIAGARTFSSPSTFICMNFFLHFFPFYQLKAYNLHKEFHVDINPPLFFVGWAVASAFGRTLTGICFTAFFPTGFSCLCGVGFIFKDRILRFSCLHCFVWQRLCVCACGSFVGTLLDFVAPFFRNVVVSTTYIYSYCILEYASWLARLPYNCSLEHRRTCGHYHRHFYGYTR